MVKNDTYCELKDNGNIFQSVALEVHGFLSEISELFVTRLCKVKCSVDDQGAGHFLKQLISMALQIRNAACVLGTVSDRCVRRSLLPIVSF